MRQDRKFHEIPFAAAAFLVNSIKVLGSPTDVEIPNPSSKPAFRVSVTFVSLASIRPFLRYQVLHLTISF